MMPGMPQGLAASPRSRRRRRQSLRSGQETFVSSSRGSRRGCFRECERSHCISTAFSSRAWGSGKSPSSGVRGRRQGRSRNCSARKGYGECVHQSDVFRTGTAAERGQRHSEGYVVKCKPFARWRSGRNGARIQHETSLGCGGELHGRRFSSRSERRETSSGIRRTSYGSRRVRSGPRWQTTRHRRKRSCNDCVPLHRRRRGNSRRASHAVYDKEGGRVCARSPLGHRAPWRRHRQGTRRIRASIFRAQRFGEREPRKAHLRSRV